MEKLLTEKYIARTAREVADFGKVPPQSVEMEESVIGACLVERDVFNTVMGIITDADCFYVRANKLVFGAMTECVSAGLPVDILTVAEMLRKNGEFEMVGGMLYLTNAAKKVTTIAHIESHARIVMEKYFAREVIRICWMGINSAFDDDTDIFDLMETIKHGIECITKDMSEGGDISIGRIFAEVLSEIDYQKKNKSALTGLDTGLWDLNEITNGWQKTDLIIIGGRPSKGKTALGLNLALSACISQIVKGVPVAIFSLEMGGNQLVKRMAATVTGIDFGKIISGNLTDDEFNTISQKSVYFNNLPIRIIDKTFRLQKLTAKARKLKDKYDIGLIVIDYLQLIKTSNKLGNREQEVSSITSDLKILAKELDVPVILLSQLNRNVEGRGNPEPSPADLRESGAIEQDADIILFPWHGENESFISVAKNRNGKVAVKDFALKIQFSGSIQKWMNKEAFEPFKQVFVPENARAGIRNNYQIDTPNSRWKKDEEFK